VSDKPSNPKDLLGAKKVPYHLWPETATIQGTLALLEGALKYGRSNWRGVGVRASIYYDALRRHANAWFEGQDNDPDSGLDHLGHALACLAIIIDARAKGLLTDDRMYPGGYDATIKAATPHVARLQEKYADRNPKHYHKGVADAEQQVSKGDPRRTEDAADHGREHRDRPAGAGLGSRFGSGCDSRD